ncbi:aklavinone 12-hydroxylase RdmE [Amycolatopsis sp. NPDC059657]|uniref:aklavinone 12-hydroxylase RdmE n=1 Tax=Amycolatopsis sp. NPDC059657 TaxID=3346899 RepID=UPI00366EC3A6
MVDVLVAGAGYGGLSATMFLAQHGVDVLAVDRHPSTSVHPRAAGQSWRTMELFRYAGIDEEVLDSSPRARAGLRITVAASLGGQVFHRLYDDTSELDVSAATAMPYGMAGQDLVEPIMLRRAEKFGATVRFNTELVSFEQDDDGVTAVLRTAGEESTVRARYLIAADGGRSRIRSALGIETDGPGALSHCLGVLFEANLGDRVRTDVTDLFYLQNPHFTAGFCSTDTPDHYGFAPDYHPSKGESPEDFTPERLIEMIRIATDEPDLEPVIHWTAPWEVAARLARRFRSGRVFLVGDAAKVTPPTGGMGGNTAIGDGHDLAWKLAAVLRGEAGPALLDTYEAERRPIARMVIDTSLHNMKQRMHPDLDVSGLTPAEDPMAICLGFRYRSSAILAEDDDPARTENPFSPSGRPGFRAPNVTLPTGESTVDVLGHGWVLFSDSTWTPAASDISAETGLRLDHHIAPPATFGLTPGGASLVRPDGIVAWRSPATDDPSGALWNALAQLLGR